MYAPGAHTQVVLLAQQAGYPHPARMTSVLVLRSPGGVLIHRLLCVLPVFTVNPLSCPLS